ncbi:MAG TPA: hypothetical protein VGL94_19915, partial [Ktedonobacteraceae bacterium]
GYILDCRTRGRSERTIEWYEQKLNVLTHWMSEEEEVTTLEEVTILHSHTNEFKHIRIFDKIRWMSNFMPFLC